MTSVSADNPGGRFEIVSAFAVIAYVGGPFELTGSYWNQFVSSVMTASILYGIVVDLFLIMNWDIRPSSWAWNFAWIALIALFLFYFTSNIIHIIMCIIIAIAFVVVLFGGMTYMPVWFEYLGFSQSTGDVLFVIFTILGVVFFIYAANAAGKNKTLDVIVDLITRTSLATPAFGVYLVDAVQQQSPTTLTCSIGSDYGENETCPFYFSLYIFIVLLITAFGVRYLAVLHFDYLKPPIPPPRDSLAKSTVKYIMRWRPWKKPVLLSREEREKLISA